MANDHMARTEGLEHAEAVVDSLKAQLETARGELERNKAAVSEQQEVVTRMQQESRVVTQQMRDDLEAKEAALRSHAERVDMLETQYDTSAAEALRLRGEVEALQAEKGESDALASLLREQLEASQEELSDTASRLTAAHATLDSVNAQLRETTGRCAELQSSVQSLQAKVSQLTDPEGVTSTHAVLGGKVVPLEQLDTLQTNWLAVPTFPPGTISANSATYVVVGAASWLQAIGNSHPNFVVLACLLLQLQRCSPCDCRHTAALGDIVAVQGYWHSHNSCRYHAAVAPARGCSARERAQHG